MNTIVDFEMKGSAPLLMHSDRFANPVAPETIEHKKLTSKRSKTTEDHHAIAKSEWMGGLYYDKGLGVYLPSNMISKCIQEGAKLFKLGRHVQRSVVFLEHMGFSLDYSGPKSPEDLYNNGKFIDTRSVKVSTARLMRCRPRFDEWSVKGSFSLNEAMMDKSDLIKSFEAAGQFVGCGDYRPMFGRFEVSIS